MPTSFDLGEDSDWPDILLSTRLKIGNFLNSLKQAAKLFDVIQVELCLGDLPGQLGGDCLRILRTMDPDLQTDL